MKRIMILFSMAFFLFQPLYAQECLTIRDFIEKAIRNNPSYQIPAREYLAALQQNKSAHSLEDWNLVASGFFNEATPPALSSFSPDYQKSAGYSAGVEKYFSASGTALRLEHSNTRVNATYPPISIPGVPSDLFAPSSPYYLSSISITIVQPLLKNAFGIAARKALALSDDALALARLKLSEDWEDLITSLRSEYLAWQKANRTASIFSDRVKAVEQQLALAKKQRRYGLSEDLDLVQLQQKLEAYRIQLELSRMAEESQKNRILKLAGGNIPSTATAEAVCQSGTILERTAALSYLTGESNVKKSSDLLVELQFKALAIKEDSRNPSVDLVAQARPNAYTHGLSDSLQKIGNNSEYTVTVNASRAIGNDRANAEAEKANEDYLKSLKQRENTLLNTEIVLDNLYVRHDHLTRVLELNQSSVELAKKRLALELKKFDQGRISAFFVLQAEDDLAQAEIIYCETLFNHELVINQINSLTDRYLIEYSEVLKLGS